MRLYPLFSACGLNCGLCPNFHLHATGKFRCPGCGGEGFAEARPSCGILSCCQRKAIEFCYECDNFPCEKYDNWDDCDSFITHRNIVPDMEKSKRIGIDAYVVEQNEKVIILAELLKGYNDGRRKTFFCLAVNLLELQEIRNVMTKIECDVKNELPIKEKAVAAVRFFEEVAEQRGVLLKKRKKQLKKLKEDTQ